MATPAPAGEPFSEALTEAAQAAAMSVRLLLTIADAVRRAAQKHHHGREQTLGEEAGKLAPGWSAEQLRDVVPGPVLQNLMRDADWPVMARQLASLQQAGVDLTTFLPQLGRMTTGVQQAVAVNAARTRTEGTDRWADLLRTTIPKGLIRDAILASPAWPDIATAMARLHDQGVDVARILTDAHTAGLGVDQAVAAVTTAAAAPPPAPAPAAAAPSTARVPRPAAPATATAPPAPAPAADQTAASWVPATQDTKTMWGPLTEGLPLPKNLHLDDRDTAMGQLDVRPSENTRLVSLLKETIGSDRETDLLIATRAWPLLACRMVRIARGPDGAPGLSPEGEPRLRARLKTLADNPTWKEGPASGLTGRLVAATLTALTTPPGTPVTGPRVSPAAARSRSTTTTPTAAPTAGRAPAEAAVPAHRQQANPTRRQGRGR